MVPRNEDTPNHVHSTLTNLILRRTLGVAARQPYRLQYEDATKGENYLTSGIDLQFCIMEDCENKEAAYEVLRFLLEDENVQAYMDNQNAVPCKKGDFTLVSMLDGMKEYIKEGKVMDFQDHFYPAEMAAEALIQTYLLDGDTDKFLKRFDAEWARYNRDLIKKVQKYEAEHREGEGQ